jgi:nucleotide-binding universal stress UspA family protein
MSQSAGDQQARIVVGVDGSEGSRQALRWAARQAGLTGAVLDAVIAWEYPALYGWAPIGPEEVDFANFAQQALSQAIEEVLGPEQPSWLRARVLQGHAAQVLVDASEGAELLVVGSRGYAAFTDALLGSVSTFCVHHAQGPITIIRPATPPKD